VCVGVGGGGGWGGFVDNAIFPAADSATALAARYSAAGFASKTRPFVAPYQLSVVHISEGCRSLALRQQRSASVPTNCRSLALTTGTTFVSLKNGQSGTKAGPMATMLSRASRGRPLNAPAAFIHPANRRDHLRRQSEFGCRDK